MIDDKFHESFYFNRVSGCKVIEVLIHKNEIGLKMILKKISINY